MLILFAVFMGIKQGYAMLIVKPEMLEMFSKKDFSKTEVMINGTVTLLSALLISPAVVLGTRITFQSPCNGE